MHAHVVLAAILTQAFLTLVGPSPSGSFRTPAMPILFACQRILQAPVGSHRILAVGSLCEILYIPAETLLGPARASPIRTSYAPTGTYTYIHELRAPDGSFKYVQEGLTIPGPSDRMYSGLKAGQCGCCYYRMREILEYTNEPGYLALMSPGWYEAEDGTWKWWHGDCQHGRPGCSCKNFGKNHLQDPGDQKNLEAQQHFAEEPDFMVIAENMGTLDNEAVIAENMGSLDGSALEPIGEALEPSPEP